MAVENDLHCNLRTKIEKLIEEMKSCFASNDQEALREKIKVIELEANSNQYIKKIAILEREFAVIDRLLDAYRDEHRKTCKNQCGICRLDQEFIREFHSAKLG